MNILIVAVLAALSLAAFVSKAQAEVVPAEVCEEGALPKLTFSVMSDEAANSLEALAKQDKADDGEINWPSTYYLAQVEELPTIEPQDLFERTFVVDRWWPHTYIEGEEAAPAIRVFLREEALVDPEGSMTTEAPQAIIYLPKQGKAMSAPDAALFFVSHVCATRAKRSGAAST